MKTSRSKANLFVIRDSGSGVRPDSGRGQRTTAPGSPGIRSAREVLRGSKPATHAGDVRMPPRRRESTGSLSAGAPFIRKTWLVIALLLGLAIGAVTPNIEAWRQGDEVAINIVIPVAISAYRAHRHRRPVGKAILQSLAGGIMVWKGLEKAGLADNRDPWQAWQGKFLVNLGSSLIESAATATQTFRADFGPLWVITDGHKTRVRVGLHSALVTAAALLDGSRFSWRDSGRIGTLAFTRPMSADGSIGFNGALAYTKGNVVTLNPQGNHAGHELVHALQYRRDNALMPGITKIFPQTRHWFRAFEDDTGWLLNWTAQKAASGMLDHNMDFDSAMEKEAYYLADRAHRGSFRWLHPSGECPGTHTRHLTAPAPRASLGVMGINAIETQGLTKTVGFFSPQTLIDSLDLTVPEGHLFGLLGPNGAGKTTTMKLLLGLARPTRGSAELFGIPVGSPRSRERVGFLPEVVNHHDHLTIHEYLAYHGRLAGLPSLSDRIEAGLKRVDMADHHHRALGVCSKGMKQRVDLARVLMLDARLILLDEPMTGLDPLGQATLKEILIGLKRDGISVLINSHAVGILEDVCTAVGIMSGGRLIRSGPLNQLLSTADYALTVTGSADDVARLPLLQNQRVTHVEQLPDQRCRFVVADVTEPQRLIATLAAGGCSILEAGPVRLSLEQLFVNTLGLPRPPEVH